MQIQTNFGVNTYSNGVIVKSGVPLCWHINVSNGFDATTAKVVLIDDAQDILAQRRSTNAQTFRVYNTWTSAGAYERLSIGWSANACYARPENAGTGVARLFIPVTGATTVSGLPTAATAGIGARCFVTDATVTTFASVVVGGGTNKVPVYSDGTNWLIG
jgi:hypothetical protein